MPERKIVLVEYFVSGDDVLIFGVRADFSEPQIITHRVDYDELRRSVLTNFGTRSQYLHVDRELNLLISARIRINGIQGFIPLLTRRTHEIDEVFTLIAP